MSVIAWSVNTLPGSLTVSKVTDLKNGVNNALDKDGSVTPTANLAMGGYGLTNIGAAGVATISITDSIAALTGKDLTLNAPTGHAINLQINGVTKASVNSDGSFDAGGLHLLNGRLSHQTSNLQLNAPTGKTIDLQINGVTKAQVDANGNLNLDSNKLVGAGTEGLRVTATGDIYLTRSDALGPFLASDTAVPLRLGANSNEAVRLDTNLNLDIRGHKLVGNGGSAGIAIDSSGLVTANHSGSGSGHVADLYRSALADGNYVDIYFGKAGANDQAGVLRHHYDAAGTGSFVSLFNWGGAATDGVTVLSGGNVGIGTTSPTEKLDVAGNIAVSGTVDDRNVANDGTKLDGIESGATADQTTSELIAGAFAGWHFQDRYLWKTVTSTTSDALYTVTKDGTNAIPANSIAIFSTDASAYNSDVAQCLFRASAVTGDTFHTAGLIGHGTGSMHASDFFFVPVNGSSEIYLQPTISSTSSRVYVYLVGWIAPS